MKNEDMLRHAELSKILHQRVLNKKELDEWKRLDEMEKKEDDSGINNIFTNHDLRFV